jgi:hypothetical protein
MAVEVFSLVTRMRAEGMAGVKADLAGIETQGARTAASLNQVPLVLDRAASAALNGTKGFRDLSGTYAAWGAETNKATGAFSSMTAKMATASGTIIHPMAMAMSQSNGRILDFGKAVATATPQVDKKARAVSELGTTLKSLGITYGAFEIGRFVKGIVESGAALHELSQRTGASVRLLSILQFQGSQSGVSIEQIAQGFRGFAMSIGNLRDGVPKTVEAFAKLGLTWNDLKGLSTDKQFELVALRIGVMKDQTEQAEVAQRVFSRGGAALLPLLEDLASKGFKAAADEAERMNAVITDEQATKLDALTDSITRLAASIKGLIREALVPATPAIAAFFDGIAAGLQQILEKGMLSFLMDKAGKGGWVDAVKHSLMFGDVDGGSSSSIGAASGAPSGGGGSNGGGGGPTDAELRRAAEAQRKRVLSALDARPASSLSGGGFIGARPGVRGGSAISADEFGGLTQPGVSGGGDSLWDDLEADAQAKSKAVQFQFANMGKNLGMAVANGFASAIAAGLQGKNVFKSFGNTVLAGLGAVFSGMGQAMIAAALPLIKLIPFLSNPLTAGPALLAAGIVLTALGATLGGIAQGSGGGGGGGGSFSDSRDRATQITLTADGAGGTKAPKGSQAQTIKVLGVDSPEGQKVFATYGARAARRNL